MKKRRGHHEGSVHLRSDGRWVGVVSLPAQSGTRKRRYVYAPTQAQAIEKLRALQQGISKGTPLADDRKTVGTYLRWYAANVLPTPRMKASTAVQYRQIIESYLIPHLGGVRLTKLSPAHIYDLQTALADRGLSPSTVRYARAVLSGALRHAERLDMVGRNAVSLVDAPPKGTSRTEDALTLPEARRLLASVRAHRLEALVSVALAVGLRRGEALGLRWVDVDLDAKTLTVTGTLKRRPGGGLFLEPPKTGGSAGTIPLPDTSVQALVQHRRRQAEERLAAGESWRDEGFIFTTPSGGPIDGSNALRVFNAMCEIAGIGRRRFHALRHSAATLMWEQGVPLDVISSTLRHSGLAITKDVYVKFRPSVVRSGAEAMDRALGDR